MSSPLTLASEAHSLLQNLYKTGANSDRVIRCAKKGRTKNNAEFKVHKCIVYTAIPTLEQIQIKNREFTVVRLAESSDVIDAMLRHVYKLPLEFVPRKGDAEEALRGKSNLESVELAVELRKAAVETQFNIPSLLPLTEHIIGNALHRTVHRTFEPGPEQLTSRFAEKEKKPSLDVQEHQAALRIDRREEVARERPLVEFVKIVLVLHEKKDQEEYHPFRVAPLFLLVTRMPKVMNCMDAASTLRSADEEFYKTATKVVLRWLMTAKKGERKEQREVASRKMREACAEYVGVEWKEQYLNEWGVFLPAKWGDERDTWPAAMLEGEEYDV